MTTRTTFQHRGFTIEREHSGDEYMFFAKYHGRLVGDAKVRESQTHGLVVELIGVEDRDRRRGVGTALYEAALKLSCETGKPLASDHQRSPFAEAFWRKQVKKGRATCHQRNTEKQENVWNGPLHDARYQAEESCERLYRNMAPEHADRCVASRMKKIEDKLPKPQGSAWPCKRFRLKPRKACLNVDLSAVLGRRRR